MTTAEQATYMALDALGVRIAVAKAVAAERARCAAVCREVADARLAACRDRPYDGRADVADECAEAIERGAVAR